MTPKQIRFIEVGPRDGLQNWPATLATASKLAMVRALAQANVTLIELTSMVSPARVPQLADAEALVSAVLLELAAERVRVLVPNLKGLERALESGARHVLVNVGVTEDFNHRNLNRSVGATLAEIARIASLADAQGVRVDASISVAWGCPFQGQVEAEQVLSVARECAQVGCRELSLADTIGVATPTSVANLCSRVLDELPGSELSVHFHDSRGLGLANLMTALECGITTFEASVGGIGGCPFAPRSTGNICSEEALFMLDPTVYQHDVDVSAMVRAAQLTSELLESDLPGRLYRAGLPWWTAEGARLEPS